MGGGFCCVWTERQAAERYPGIYRHVLLFDEFTVDSQRGYRSAHGSDKSVIGFKSARPLARSPKKSRNYITHEPPPVAVQNVYFHHA